MTQTPPNNGNQPTTDPELDRIDSDITKHRKYAKRLVITVFAIFFIYFSIAVLIDISLDKDNNWIKPEWAKIYTVDSGHWGTFGDFIGGILNPTFALLAFYWLTYSVRLQIKELRDTKQELRRAAQAQEDTAKHQEEIARIDMENVNTQKEILDLQKQSLKDQAISAKAQQHQIALQNFENLFFELLKTKTDLLNNIVHKRESFLFLNQNSKDVITSGKNAIYEHMYDFKKHSHKIEWDKYYSQYLLNSLGNYFRLCYQILNLLDKNETLRSFIPYYTDVDLNYSEEQKKYFDIFRSTLSQSELEAFFFNGISQYYGINLKRIIEKYGLFEPLLIDQNEAKVFYHEITKYAYKYSIKAFEGNHAWIEYFKDISSVRKNIDQDSIIRAISLLCYFELIKKLVFDSKSKFIFDIKEDVKKDYGSEIYGFYYEEINSENIKDRLEEFSKQNIERIAEKYTNTVFMEKIQDSTWHENSIAATDSLKNDCFLWRYIINFDYLNEIVIFIKYGINPSEYCNFINSSLSHE